MDAQGPQAAEAERAFRYSTDGEGNLVIHGGARNAVIRRLTVYQVDEIRFHDIDDAIRAACGLLSGQLNP